MSIINFREKWECFINLYTNIFKTETSDIIIPIKTPEISLHTRITYDKKPISTSSKKQLTPKNSRNIAYLHVIIFVNSVKIIMLMLQLYQNISIITARIYQMMN